MMGLHMEERYYIGWKSKTQFWVRFTNRDGFYLWLHPVTRQWVSEPNQIDMPDFKTRADAEAALHSASSPELVEVA